MNETNKKESFQKTVFNLNTEDKDPLTYPNPTKEDSSQPAVTNITIEDNDSLILPNPTEAKTSQPTVTNITTEDKDPLFFPNPSKEESSQPTVTNKKKYEIVLTQPKPTLIKCWTCWENKFLSNCLKATDLLNEVGIHSVREVISKCVPQVSILDDSVICKKCSKKLSIVSAFINKAVHIEQILRQQDLKSKKVNEFGQLIKMEEDSIVKIEKKERVETLEVEDENSESEKEGSTNRFGSEDDSFQGWDSSQQNDDDKSSENVYYIVEHSDNILNNKENSDEQQEDNKPVQEKKLTLEAVKNFKPPKINLKNLKPCKLKCGKCGKVFATFNNYQKHYNDVKDAPCCDYVKCDPCNIKFSKEDFRNHSTKVHGSLICAECGKMLGSQIAMVSHMRNVHPKEIYTCSYCDTPIKTLNALQNHVKHSHPETIDKDLQKFPCDRCPKRYEKKTSLERHKKWHDNIRDFHCDYCYKSFFTSNELLSHTRLMHSTEETFFCKLCGKGFVRSDYLRRHESYHVKYENSSCTICKKLFRSEAKLMYHMQAGHSEDGVSLEQPKDLPPEKKTVKSTGKVVGHYKTKCICKICKKVIANPFGLRVHYKSHLKLKSFKCSFCGVLLQSPISLKRHEALHKDPNYKFACKICHARKNSEAELEYHENTVHKTKRYKCHLCQEAFGRRYLLDSHQATEHADEISKRELILEELSKETMYLDPMDDHNALFRGPKNNKGTKVGVDDSEINEICNKVKHNEYSYDDMIEDDDDEGVVGMQVLKEGAEGQKAAENLQVTQHELEEHTLHEIRPGEFIAFKQEVLDEGVQVVEDLGDGEYAIVGSEEDLAKMKAEAGGEYAYVATDGDFPGNQVVRYVEEDSETTDIREITEEEYQMLKDGQYLVYEDEQGNTVTLEAAMEGVESEEAATTEDVQMELDQREAESDHTEKKENNLEDQIIGV